MRLKALKPAARGRAEKDQRVVLHFGDPVAAGAVLAL